MDNFAEKKNSEGYSDPTPYKAIKNMIKPGEIWTFQKKDNTEPEVLVVAFSDSVATILFLMDEYKEGCVECVSKSLKWVNPRMLNWSWGGYLNKCIRKLDDREFKQITAQLEKVLSVKVCKELDSKANPVPDPAASREVENMKHELDALYCRCKELDSKAAKYVEAYKQANNEVEKTKVQLEMLKGMYSELMEKYLKRA